MQPSKIPPHDSLYFLFLMELNADYFEKSSTQYIVAAATFWESRCVSESSDMSSCIVSADYLLEANSNA